MPPPEPSFRSIVRPVLAALKAEQTPATVRQGCPNGKDEVYGIPPVGLASDTLLPDDEIGGLSWTPQLAWVTIISTISIEYRGAIQKGYFAVGILSGGQGSVAGPCMISLALTAWRKLELDSVCREM